MAPFFQPTYAREKKTFGRCWDQTQIACVASDRVVHYSMPPGSCALINWISEKDLQLSKPPVFIGKDRQILHSDTIKVDWLEVSARKINQQ